MRKGTIQKIEEEINEKRKMPKEVKESLRKEIFTNIIICACLVVYFLFLFLGSVDKTKAVRAIDLKIFSTMYLATSIILFEIAYRKDSGKLAIHGIEVLLVAIITLFLPYIIFELDSKYQKIYAFVGEYIAAYYVIKCICIAIARKRKYSKDVSDIKEIIKKEKRTVKNEDEENIEEKAVVKSKDEKPKRKASTKKKIAEPKEVKTRKTKKTESNIEENKKAKETKKPEKKDTEKTTTKASSAKSKTLKTQTNPKTEKITIKQKTAKEVEEKKEEAPKRRGRPKKQETVQKEIREEIKTEPAPKRRGGPRKVVNQ